MGFQDRLQLGTSHAYSSTVFTNQITRNTPLMPSSDKTPNNVQEIFVATFRFRIMMLLPHHKHPRTIVHNNIFGGEGARRFQPQDSITLFPVSEFCSMIDNMCIRDNWDRDRGQEGSSWYLAHFVENGWYPQREGRLYPQPYKLEQRLRQS